MCDVEPAVTAEQEELNDDCSCCMRRERLNELEKIGYHLLMHFRDQGIRDPKIIVGLLAEELGLVPCTVSHVPATVHKFN